MRLWTVCLSCLLCHESSWAVTETHFRLTNTLFQWSPTSKFVLTNFQFLISQCYFFNQEKISKTDNTIAVPHLSDGSKSRSKLLFEDRYEDFDIMSDYIICLFLKILLNSQSSVWIAGFIRLTITCKKRRNWNTTRMLWWGLVFWPTVLDVRVS